MTSTAFFPPSSRWTCLRFSAASRMTWTPVSREPVMVMTGTSGWATIRLPTSPPPPWTTLMTPAGTPASTSSSTKRSPSAGVSVAGLKTTVFPHDERRDDLPGGDRDREVPRRDHADHADRHAHAHVELVPQLGGRRLPEEAPPLPAHVVAHVDRFLDVAAGLRQHLPHLVAHQVGEVVLVLGQELREAEDDLAPLRRRDEPPLLVGRLRGLDGAVDVLGARTSGRRRSCRRSPGSCSRRSRRRRRRPTRRR